MKAQALTDHLAENPVDGDYEPLDTYFPDEGINSIEEVGSNGNQACQLYFNGATNNKKHRDWGNFNIAHRARLPCNSSTSLLL